MLVMVRSDDRRGISSIVSLMLIILGTIIGAALLWVFVLKTTGKSSETADADCFTLNIEPLKCDAYAACDYNSGTNYYEADILLRRNVGRGNVTGLRFIFESSQGIKGAYDKTLTSDLDELQTLNFVEPFGSIPIIGGPVIPGQPHTLRIAALMGVNKDVCPIASSDVKCPLFNTQLPFGNVSNSSYMGIGQYTNNRREGYCCQYPKNFSECYNGNDPAYPIDPVTRRLIGQLPPGNKTVCCQLVPYNGTRAVP